MLRRNSLCNSNNKKLIISSNFLLSIMPSKFSLYPKPSLLPSFHTPRLLHTTHTLTFCTNSAKPVNNSPPISLKTRPRFYSDLPAISPPPVSLEGPTSQSDRISKLVRDLEGKGIKGFDAAPGQYTHLLCPRCKGGVSGEKALTVHISADGNVGVWRCHRGTCGWNGHHMAIDDVVQSHGKSNKNMKLKNRILKEDNLNLEPLCNELLEYFAERMISPGTLNRNYVLQKKTGNQVVIAFTYRRGGNLIGCKYRDANKNFWQVAAVHSFVV